jgi:hypothetical protein
MRGPHLADCILRRFQKAKANPDILASFRHPEGEAEFSPFPPSQLDGFLIEHLRILLVVSLDDELT